MYVFIGGDGMESREEHNEVRKLDTDLLGCGERTGSKGIGW